jgi:hypothetical protein
VTAVKVLAEARKDLGLTGRPNKITRSYSSRNGSEFLRAAWCDQGVTEWGRRADSAGAVLPKGDRAYTIWHAEDGRGLGRWYAGTAANVKAHAKPGAIVFFDWDGSDAIGRIDHVGVVEKNLGDGRLQTIEANTSDAVMRRVRAANVIAGFWNPPYEEEDDMPSAKEIAEAVYDRFSSKVTADVWAAREKILDVGQEIDPRTALRQIWAYTKDGYQRDREILKQLGAQDATIKALVNALAARDSAIDADALIEQIRSEIENVSINLSVGK